MTQKEAIDRLLFDDAEEIIKDIYDFFQGRKQSYCRICGKEFTRKGSAVTCSHKCSLENQRQNKRRSWHKLKENKDKYELYLKQKMYRIRKRKMND